MTWILLTIELRVLGIGDVLAERREAISFVDEALLVSRVDNYARIMVGVDVFAKVSVTTWLVVAAS